LALSANRSRLKDVKGVVPGGMVGKEHLKQLINLQIREAVKDFKRLDQIPRKRRRSKENNFSLVSRCTCYGAQMTWV